MLEQYFLLNWSSLQQQNKIVQILAIINVQIWSSLVSASFLQHCAEVPPDVKVDHHLTKIYAQVRFRQNYHNYQRLNTKKKSNERSLSPLGPLPICSYRQNERFRVKPLSAFHLRYEFQSAIKRQREKRTNQNSFLSTGNS